MLIRQKIIKWSTDASFAVHQDMKSHTGITMSMGKGSVISASRKQKMNTRSSTEAELVAADDAVTHYVDQALPGSPRSSLEEDNPRAG